MQVNTFLGIHALPYTYSLPAVTCLKQGIFAHQTNSSLYWLCKVQGDEPALYMCPPAYEFNTDAVKINDLRCRYARDPQPAIISYSAAPPLDNHQCGIKGRSGRIIGGVAAESHDWPWVVMLLMKGQSSSHPDRMFCSGSIIDEYHILTAAQCIDG